MGMLYHDLKTPDAQPYMRQVSLTLKGIVDPTLCETVWNKLLQRHALLRSTFDYEKTEQPLQIILKIQTIAFHYEDVSQEGVAAIERWQHMDELRGFDLRCDKLIRIGLFRLEPHLNIMIWSHPHILLDGWSGAILAEEFNALYAASLEEGSLHGAEAALQSAPDPESILAAIAARDETAAMIYWRALLEGYEELATLPRESSRRPSFDHAHETRNVCFSETQTQALRTLAASHDATLGQLVQVIWGLLLGVWTGRQDVVFGIVVSGRSSATVEATRLVGMLINTIPVRVRWNGDETIGEALKNLSMQAAASSAHDHIGLAALQARPDITSDLLDHVIAIENYPSTESAPTTRGFSITHADVKERSNYDFGLLVHDGQCLEISLEYNARLAAEQMERIEHYLRALVEDILANPSIELQDYNPMPAAEAKKLLGFSFGQKAPVPQKDLATLWHAQTDKTPHNPALVAGDMRLTYSELDREAEGIANHLRAADIMPGTIVGVFCDRSAARIAALLGILKAGCIYLPLSRALPDSRIAFILEDAGCRHIIASPEETTRLRVFCTSHSFIPASGKAEGRSPSQTKTDDLAYIIYTSGSTGQPKGVAIEHRGFINMIVAQIEGFGIHADDHVLQFASCSFDASLSEIFMALLRGACLVMAPSDAIRDGAALLDFMKREAVSVATLPPSYLQALESEDLASLRVLITAGEPPDSSTVSRCANRLKVFNAYGPSEASVCASWHEIERGRDYTDGVPIGRPIANTGLSVRDALGRLMPFGTCGEICIEGPGLARGYVGQETLTKERFPFINDVRLYRTGDAGIVRENGEIFYAGRLDGQIKLNGYRIELGEIEQHLLKHPAVAQAVATITTDPKRLIAFIVLHKAPCSLASNDDLRQLLAQDLPSWMVPVAIITLDAIPLTLTGKVDRRALALMQVAQEFSFLSNHEMPINANERLVASAFAAVLGGGPYGRNMSFTEAGGDSLRAIRLLGRLRREGYGLNLQDLLAAGTIANIACSMRADKTSDETAATGRFPLTPIQRWFFDIDPKGKARLAHLVLLRFIDQTEEARSKRQESLTSVITALVDHHDALRLHFTQSVEGWICDCATSESVAKIRFVDLCESDDPQFALMEDTRLHPPAAAAEGISLFQATHYRLPDTDYLLLTAHHLLIDAVSWRILIEDFSDALQQASDGLSIKLPPKTVSYRDWASALANESSLAAVEPERLYWERVIYQTQTSQIPRHDYEETEIVSATLSSAETIRSERHGLAQLLASVGAALHAWDGRDSVYIVLTGHGRDASHIGQDVSRTIGWFSADYPFRFDCLAGEETIEAALETVPSHGASWGSLRWLSPKPINYVEPIIAVNFLGSIDMPTNRDFELCELLPPVMTQGFSRTRQLEIEAYIIAGQLRFAIRYAPRFTLPEEIHRLKDRMIDYAEHIDRPVSGA